MRLFISLVYLEAPAIDASLRRNSKLKYTANDNDFRIFRCMKNTGPGRIDDAPVAQGLLRALSVLGGVMFVVLAIFFFQGPGPGNSENAPSEYSGPGIRPPTARFDDITRSAGIGFVHENGACGEKLLPETMGGGVAFLDFDNDGDPDLMFVNGMHWPECDEAGESNPTNELYRNDTLPGGEVEFVNVTDGSGLDTPIYGMGVATGDYDGDGFVDVFITAVGENRLFRNLGTGRFEDVTASTGVGGSTETWSTSTAFFDYDNDDDLDLFVCNYIEWSREIDLALDYHLAGIGKSYGPPFSFQGAFPYLYRNNGNGSFTDVTADSGLQISNKATGQPLAKALGVSPVDLDNDGWLDLVVANDTVQNLVFQNQRDGTFNEVGAASGLAFDSFGGTRGAMGIDTAWTVGDSQLAIAIGNFANEMTALYVSQNTNGNGPRSPVIQYSDQAIAHGIGPASRDSLTFGVFFFDYDLDGREDLLTVNGHIEPEIGGLRTGQSYRQSAQLFWNAHGDQSGFIPVTDAEAGADIFESIVGRGSAFADIDSDGDPDVVMTQVGGPAKLLRNDQSLGNHWLKLKLTGNEPNRDAIGAAVKVKTGRRTFWRRVMAARGYLSQSELTVTIGLGKDDTPPVIEITWPDGMKQEVIPDGVNRLIEITQSKR